KLDWLNGVYLRALSHAEFFERLAPFLKQAGIQPHEARERLAPVLADLQERMRILSEGPDAVSFFFRDEVDYDPAMLVARRSCHSEALRMLQAALACLEQLPDFSTPTLDSALHQLADDLGVRAGTLFTPIRVAATGRTQAPPLFSTLAAVGRETILRRLKIAMKKLEQSDG